MSDTNPTTPINIDPNQHGQRAITYHPNTSASTVRDDGRDADTDDDYDSDVDVATIFSRSPTGSTVQSAATTKEDSRLPFPADHDGSVGCSSSSTAGPNVRYGRGFQRPSIVTGASIHTRRPKWQARSHAAEAEEDDVEKGEEGEQQMSAPPRGRSPRPRSPRARYGKGLQRPSAQQWETRTRGRNSFRGTVQDLMGQPESTAADMEKEKMESSERHKSTRVTDSHQNVYTRAGRHSDDWLFGGWSISGSLKKVFARK